MYGLLQLVRPPGRYLNDDSEMKLVMETRLFVIHRLTTRHSSDEVNPDKEKTPDDVLSWRNMEMSSSLPLHFPIEFTLTPSSSSACRPHSASPLYTYIYHDNPFVPQCKIYQCQVMVIMDDKFYNQKLLAFHSHYATHKSIHKIIALFW